jgi:predicted acyl esterase
MRQSTDRRTPRPVGPAAAALSKMLSRAWSLPPQRNFVAIERNVQVPMSDGTVLLADHYLPITSQPAATVLEIGLSAANLSALVVSQTAGKAAAHV